MSVTADASALFAALTGSTPSVLWSAPGRVNLIGEHTDYNGGFVLPFAISQRTVAAVRLRDDKNIRVASTFGSGSVEVPLAELDGLFRSPKTFGESASHTRLDLHGRPIPDWAAYPLGMAWVLSTRAADAARFPGADIAIASDVPVGAGLSSSAAIESAVGSALNELWGLGLDRVAVADAGRTAENEAVGAPTGVMDQMAAMLGRRDAAVFIDCRSLEASVVPLGFVEAGLMLLVIDTGVKHAHSTGDYRDRRASCEEGAARLGVPDLRDLSIADLPRAYAELDEITFRRVRHIVTENQRVLDTVTALAAEGPRAIGRLLTDSHRSMRDDFEISIAELDTAVDAALSAGALGARMTGGGFGGSAIALVEESRGPEVSAAVHAAFAVSGFEVPRLFPVFPSDGACRE